MAFPNNSTANIQSITNFAKDNEFDFLDYNAIEIVDKVYEEIKGKQSYIVDGITIETGNKTASAKIANIIIALSTSTENTIVYCGQRAKTESYAKEIINNQTVATRIQSLSKNAPPQVYNDFIQHLERVFGKDWIVLRALKCGIGIHHGFIPKYIQKEIISLFNNGVLVALFSTTTITEGVNTTAKNIVITSAKKGTKPLKQFDAKNIAGRAGRFHKHYVGRVLSIDKDFLAIVNGDENILGHKNYDQGSSKTDIDFQITNEKYLSRDDLQEKNRIDELVRASQIPNEIFNAFRVVGPLDKLTLFERVMRLSQREIRSVQVLTQTLAINKGSRLDWDGFQLIMNTIFPIVGEKKLIGLIERQVPANRPIGTTDYSLITILLSAYLEGGYMGMVKYNVETKKLSKDEAIRNASDNVYNVFKYHLVKYLGLFDIFYRYVIAARTERHIDDVPGVGILLQKLEYNALTKTARRLSDFGVPFRLVSYYDQEDKQSPKAFDAYEQYIDGKIQSLLD